MGEHLTWEEKREKIQTLNLTSDVFAGKVLEEPEVLEEFLNLLTGRRWHICEVKSQYSIRQILGHSVVLDLYAMEEDGTRIHLELQTKITTNIYYEQDIAVPVLIQRCWTPG